MKELLNRNRLGTVSREKYKGLKPVSLERNLTLVSDAAQNYKYMFGPQRGHVYVKYLSR